MQTWPALRYLNAAMVSAAFYVGIGEHHHRRMAAELHGGALHALRRQRGEVLADRDRAGERYFPHRVLGEQMLGHLRRHAEHEVEHAGGDPGVGKAAHHLDAGARRSSDALRMSEQPAASAPPILRAGEHGKFHGVNAATTPTGSETTSWRMPFMRPGTTRP